MEQKKESVFAAADILKEGSPLFLDENAVITQKHMAFYGEIKETNADGVLRLGQGKRMGGSFFEISDKKLFHIM